MEWTNLVVNAMLVLSAGLVIGVICFLAYLCKQSSDMEALKYTNEEGELVEKKHNDSMLVTQSMLLGQGAIYMAEEFIVFIKVGNEIYGKLVDQAYFNAAAIGDKFMVGLSEDKKHLKLA